ncbi:MAG TPA: rhodanese-like domain-containing protein [Flavobacteriaceae bacterium]|nr:rhodanese-like domain-containing protein [Flavobacteriaceae bacterium]
MDITLDQWQEQLKADADAIIIDVRKEDEVAEGYIKNAINIDVENPPKFMEETQKLDPSKAYYVYCRTGDRSMQACMVLESLGFENVYKLDVGYEGWVENGNEVER